MLSIIGASNIVKKISESFKASIYKRAHNIWGYENTLPKNI
jgi:hypothetical protein